MEIILRITTDVMVNESVFYHRTTDSKESRGVKLARPDQSIMGGI
jgi:hypothetical protein